MGKHNMIHLFDESVTNELFFASCRVAVHEVWPRDKHRRLLHPLARGHVLDPDIILIKQCPAKGMPYPSVNLGPAGQVFSKLLDSLSPSRSQYKLSEGKKSSIRPLFESYSIRMKTVCPGCPWEGSRACCGSSRRSPGCLSASRGCWRAARSATSGIPRDGPQWGKKEKKNKQR